MVLANAYLALRPDADAPGLESTLSRLCADVEAALPDVPLDRTAFVEALAGLPKAADQLAPERVSELALGLACADASPPALRRLETDYLAHLPRSIASMKLDPSDVDDVVQEVRRKLLVAEPGQRPKIAAYAGRGSLRGLLKVTATRTALSMLRKSGRESPADDAMERMVGEAEPELSFLKARYRAAFKEAFEEAVQQLEPRQRNLLRLHFLRKVTLEDLASMYGVHRATVVRHLARARDDIDRATQRVMRSQLEVSPRELESVMDLIRSRFEVSVERLLRTQEQE